MRNGWKKAGLIGLGAMLGLLLSLNFSAMAEKEARLPIPYDDLQLFSAVFGRIKSDYVEAVPDDKLIREAINGMVHGLDPHSDFLDAEAFRELQVSTQGRFGGLGIEVGVEDGIIKVISPIEDTQAFRSGVKAGAPIRADCCRLRSASPRLSCPGTRWSSTPTAARPTRACGCPRARTTICAAEAKTTCAICLRRSRRCRWSCSSTAEPRRHRRSSPVRCRTTSAPS